MDIMRMESGFLHWGHDISPEENQLEAGLDFAISYKKNIDFIGKDALLKLKEKSVSKKMIMLNLNNSKPGEPLLLHDEPIYLDKEIVGRTTSGNYSFNYGKNLAFGYVKTKFLNGNNSNKDFYIEIEKKLHQAQILDKPLNKSNFKNI
jgi:glycine cleavage system aminomethyltransferase T